MQELAIVLYHMKSNYKSNAVAIFGAKTRKNTKRFERLRIEKRKQSAAISFTQLMVHAVSEESFLANSKNKEKFPDKEIYL